MSYLIKEVLNSPKKVGFFKDKTIVNIIEVWNKAKANTSNT